jgi:hypothetical protein
LWFNLDAFSEYNNFVLWDTLYCVGAVKNSSLDFFWTYIINDTVYYMGFELIPNSNFALPENFDAVFEAGQDSIGVVADNKIKFYSAKVRRDPYDKIFRWDGWEYLDTMDFVLDIE